MTDPAISFSVSMTLDLSSPAPGELLALGESVQVFLREGGVDPLLAQWDQVDQNYMCFPIPDGRVLVLEALVRYDTPDEKRRTQRIGLPLGILSQLRTDHAVELRVGRVHLQLLIDGELIDEEWPIDHALPISGQPVRATRVKSLTLDMADPPVAIHSTPEPSNLQYYSPPGHNVWAGDTMCLVHEGVFHLFYLRDRRHGASRFRTGCHAISHAVSTDLRTWNHLPQAVPITQRWLSCGTGVPIVRDGQILIFFGMHTSRVVPREQTTTPAQLDDLKRTGTSHPVPFYEGGRFPEGTAIASSGDATHFAIDPTVIHPCQNPSPFIDDQTGKVYLLAGYGDAGLYASDDLKHWKLVDAKFTPCNRETPQGNTLECQCHFGWNGWYYLVAGRSGFWMSRNPLGPFWKGAANAEGSEVNSPRWDIYDGLWVPMVAAWKGNRRILSGWMTGPGFDWGGHLVFRELIQHEDGTLGTRWVNEMIPEAGPELRAPSDVRVDAGSGTTVLDAGSIPSSCRITCRVIAGPGTGAFGLRLASAELKFSPARRRVQWATNQGTTPAADLPVLEEILAIEPYSPIWSNPHPHLHFKGGDFAIQNVEGLDQPFDLDLLIIEDRKSGSTLIDTCIDNRRTMITRRVNLKPESLGLFAANGNLLVQRLTIRPLVGRQ